MNEDDTHAREELLKILRATCIDFESAVNRTGQFSSHAFSLNFQSAVEDAFGILSDLSSEFATCEYLFPEEDQNGF